MKRFLTLIAILMAAGLTWASPDSLMLKVTNAGTGVVQQTDTSYPVYGYLDEIRVDIMKAGSTGSVAIVAITNTTYQSEFIVYTNASLSADVTARPRFAQTDTAASTNTVLERVLLFGAQLQLRCTGFSLTNKDVRAAIIIDNGSNVR